MAVDNFSQLNANNFRFYLARADYLNFFTQTVDLPTVSLDPAEYQNPFSTIMLPGDHLQFDPLPVTFIVDEDLNGYMQIFNWMKGLGFPESFEEYSALIDGEIDQSLFKATTEDIIVVSMTGARRLNIKFTFKDAFPVSLTAPKLSSAVSGIPTLTCTATFTYTNFTVEPI